MPATLRPYDPPQDHAALRTCIVQLQEQERAIDARMPAGEEMADDFLASIDDSVGGPNTHIVVAELDGAVIGFARVQLHLVDEDPDASKIPYALLDEIVVLESARRRGIGQQLVDWAVSVAREAGDASIRLNVIDGNVGAQTLYDRNGFRPLYLEMEKPLD